MGHPVLHVEAFTKTYNVILENNMYIFQNQAVPCFLPVVPAQKDLSGKVYGTPFLQQRAQKSEPYYVCRDMLYYCK